MKNAFLRISERCLVVGLSLSLAAMPAAAGTPKNLADIAYQSHEWGSEQLRFRGYTLISSNPHNGKTVEYWWNGTKNSCVQARAASGKYESINTTSSTDCNQYHMEAVKNDNTAAIAIGAAALIGVAILAHNSHERDDKHSQDSKSVAEFDRGYRDGLHHERYHNYQDTQAYSDGYTAGQKRRDEETQHRARDGHHSGYHPYVALGDLVGARASSADSQLRARGFKDTGGYKQGNRSFVTWWNARSRQCVQAVTVEGKIRRFENINEGNCT